MRLTGKTVFPVLALLFIVGAAAALLSRKSSHSESGEEKQDGVDLTGAEYRISQGISICLEAENADSLDAPIRLRDDAEASNGKCVEIPRKAGNPPEVQGRAVYSITIENPGEYILWGRVWWEDSCGNSLSLVMDGGNAFTFGQDSTYKYWHWVPGPTYTLGKGTHSLDILNREDGVRLDQVFLTQDKDYVPVGFEGSLE